MPDRALRLGLGMPDQAFARPSLNASNARQGIKTPPGGLGGGPGGGRLNASNARQGIKTDYIPTHDNPPTVVGLNASNARQGIKTPLRRDPPGRPACDGLNASNARQGIKTSRSWGRGCDGGFSV